MNIHQLKLNININGLFKETINRDIELNSI